MKVLKAALVFTLLALLATTVSASDFDIGAGARSIAMGGAGLALGDGLGTTAVLNPAAPAATGASMKFVWPGMSFHTSGASIGDLADSISNVSDGNTDDAISLVNDFAKQTTRLSMSTQTGFVGPFGIVLQGEAQGIITPSADAAEWADAALKFDDTTAVDLDALTASITNAHFQSMITNANTANLAGAQADYALYLADLSQNFVDADVIYGPQVMLSHGYEKPNGTMYLGATARFLHSESRRWQITATADPANPVAGAGAAITAGVNFDAVEIPVQKADSLGVDLGMIYKPKKSVWQYGAVVNNAIKPTLKGINNDQQDTMLSVGVAMLPLKGVIFAADLVNLTGANGDNAQLRFGAESKLGSLFALRAGYSGQNWTYGFKVLGINMAFQGKSAQLLTNVIKF